MTGWAAGWMIGALFPLLEMLSWRRHWMHQLKHGADAPTHFEAAAARGKLDAPFFGEYQPSGPGTHWAYVGPRAVLLAYWPFVGLWKRGRAKACVAWQFAMAACMCASVGLLWPQGMSLGWWCVPLVALLVWSWDDTGMLGASNPLSLLLLALGLTAGGPVAAGAWFGAAVATRIWPLGYAPLMVITQPGLFASTQMFASALVVGSALTALAWALGFGYETPMRLLRLGRALNIGPLAKLTAFHKRRPYALMAAPFLMWPGAAFVAGLAGCAYVACVLNTRRWCQDMPVDIAFLWHDDWRGGTFRM